MFSIAYNSCLSTEKLHDILQAKKQVFYYEELNMNRLSAFGLSHYK